MSLVAPQVRLETHGKVGAPGIATAWAQVVAMELWYNPKERIATRIKVHSFFIIILFC
jgi:hypothetical protein